MSRTTKKELLELIDRLNTRLNLKKGDNHFIELEIQTLECRWYKLTTFDGSTNLSINMVAKDCERFIRGMTTAITLQQDINRS